MYNEIMKTVVCLLIIMPLMTFGCNKSKFVFVQLFPAIQVDRMPAIIGEVHRIGMFRRIGQPQGTSSGYGENPQSLAQP